MAASAGSKPRRVSARLFPGSALPWGAASSPPAACTELLSTSQGDVRVLCWFWAGPQAQGVTASEQLWGPAPKAGAKALLDFQEPVQEQPLILPWAGFKLSPLACSVGCAKLRNTAGQSRQSPAEQGVTVTAEPADTLQAKRGWARPGTPQLRGAESMGPQSLRRIHRNLSHKIQVPLKSNHTALTLPCFEKIPPTPFIRAQT